MELTTSSLHFSNPWRRLITPMVARLAAGILLALVFQIDLLTGDAPSQHLYYIPIAFLASSFAFSGALIGAGLSVVLYHIANKPVPTFAYEEADFIRIFVFFVVGIVIAKIADDARRFRELAGTDDLTGLHNLRSFEAHLKNLVEDCLESGSPLSILVLDVDRLKSINDRHGHLAGAEAVRLVGRIIHGAIPEAAVACRYGGDEFVIAVPNCDESCVADLANALRASVSGEAPTLAGREFPRSSLSVSLGTATACFMTWDADASRGGTTQIGSALFAAADQQLYRSKNGGRDRVSGISFQNFKSMPSGHIAAASAEY
ncbi:MAG: GGDEF domain-containing protein [Bdellovibrionota bacterium]